MTRTEGYSLWLMPSGDVYNKLATLISRLSQEYSTPNFIPHVTLLGEIMGSREEILSSTSRLATLIPPYEINLTVLAYLKEYFKSLFIKVEETTDVMNANLKARKIFNRQPDPKYMPHLSLMYGDFSRRTKEEIIVRIGEGFKISFKARSIHLFSTNGEPRDWYRVKEFTLK